MDICLYIRMSTNMQENSVESQQTVLYAYAKSHKLNIVREYIDEGISGRKAIKRPAFMQMIDDSATGLFDAVLIYDSSRFARNLEESIVYKSLLKRNGVSLISVTEPTADDDTALITDALFGAMNEMYSRKLSTAVKRGIKFRSEQGYFMGTPCFGYEKSDVKGVPQINKREADIVIHIFSLFTTTLPSYAGIAKVLNDKGDYLNNSQWLPRDVKRVLVNRAYIGDNPWALDHKGLQRPIVDNETFDTAQDIIARRDVNKFNTHTRDGITYRHWLSGIYRCSLCGGGMVFNPNSHRKADYFRCRRSGYGICKPTTQINVKRAEAFVITLLRDIADRSPDVDYANVVRASSVSEDVKSLKAQIEKMEKRIVRYTEAYSDGIDTLDEYKRNKSAALNRIATLQSQLDKLNDAPVVPLDIYVTMSRSILATIDNPNKTILEKNTALRAIISSIVYDKATDTATVFFNI